MLLLLTCLLCDVTEYCQQHRVLSAHHGEDSRVTNNRKEDGRGWPRELRELFTDRRGCIYRLDVKNLMKKTRAFIVKYASVSMFTGDDFELVPLCGPLQSNWDLKYKGEIWTNKKQQTLLSLWMLQTALVLILATPKRFSFFHEENVQQYVCWSQEVK